SKEGIRVNTPHGGGFRWSKPQALGAKSHRPREGSRRTTEALRRYGIGASPSPYQQSRSEREDAGDHRRSEERARPRRALPRSRRAEERPGRGQQQPRRRQREREEVGAAPGRRAERERRER